VAGLVSHVRHEAIMISSANTYKDKRYNRSAYVSIRQHTSAYVSIRQHTSAYVGIRQHTPAYVSSANTYKDTRDNRHVDLPCQSPSSEEANQRAFGSLCSIPLKTIFGKVCGVLQVPLLPHTASTHSQDSLNSALLEPQQSLNRGLIAPQ
jgi:hypothetical protein